MVVLHMARGLVCDLVDTIYEYCDFEEGCVVDLDLFACRAPGSRSSWPRRERNGNGTSRNASEPTHRGLIQPLSFPPPLLPFPSPFPVSPSMPTCRRKRVLLIETPTSLLQALKSDPNKHVYYLTKTGEIFDTYEQVSIPSFFYLQN